MPTGLSDLLQRVQQVCQGILDLLPAPPGRREVRTASIRKLCEDRRRTDALQVRRSRRWKQEMNKMFEWDCLVRRRGSVLVGKVCGLHVGRMNGEGGKEFRRLLTSRY